MNEEVVRVDEMEMIVAQNEGALMMKLKGKMMEWMNVGDLDEETTRMVKKIMILRISTKHINLWIRQLEMDLQAIS